jgi:hypothetical protein
MNELEDENRSLADPLATCVQSGYMDLFLRVLMAFLVALLCWREIDQLTASVVFLYLFFFMPRVTSQDLTLKSGRVVKQVTPKFTRCLYGRNVGKKVLDVCYTCCCEDIGSLEMRLEFAEVCAAVFSSCDQRGLLVAEVTAELPRKTTFFGLSLLPVVARSAEFAKEGEIWHELEGP